MNSRQSYLITTAHINATTLIWLFKVSTIWWCHISCSGNRKSCTGSGLDQKRPTIAQKWQIWIPIWCQFGSSRPCDPGSRFRVLHFLAPLFKMVERGFSGNFWKWVNIDFSIHIQKRKNVQIWAYHYFEKHLNFFKASNNKKKKWEIETLPKTVQNKCFSGITINFSWV